MVVSVGGLGKNVVEMSSAPERVLLNETETPVPLLLVALGALVLPLHATDVLGVMLALRPEMVAVEDTTQVFESVGFEGAPKVI